jgi:hypothetical protein
MKLATGLLIYTLLYAAVGGAAAFGYAGIDDLLWSALAPFQPVPLDVSKALLYEEVPNFPNGRRFVSSAVWHSYWIARPQEITVWADIEIPERHIGDYWLLRRNDELPARHTFEMIFKLPPDDPHGGISGIDVLMTATESTPGDLLAGKWTSPPLPPNPPPEPSAPPSVSAYTRDGDPATG